MKTQVIEMSGFDERFVAGELVAVASDLTAAKVVEKVELVKGDSEGAKYRVVAGREKYPPYPKVYVSEWDKKIHIQSSTTGDPSKDKKLMKRRLTAIRDFLSKELAGVYEIGSARQEAPFELSHAPGTWHWAATIKYEVVLSVVRKALDEVRKRDWR